MIHGRKAYDVLLLDFSLRSIERPAGAKTQLECETTTIAQLARFSEYKNRSITRADVEERFKFGNARFLCAAPSTPQVKLLICMNLAIEIGKVCRSCTSHGPGEGDEGGGM